MRKLVWEKENSEFKPVKLRLKIDLVSYPARAEGLVNMITRIARIVSLIKKNLPHGGFYRSSGSQSQNQRKRKETQGLGPRQITKNVVGHEGDGDTSCNLCTWNGPQNFGKRTGRVGNQKKNRDYPDNSLLEIDQNTENSPRHLGRSNDKFETGFQIFVQVIRYLEMNPTMMLIRCLLKSISKNQARKKIGFTIVYSTSFTIFTKQQVIFIFSFLYQML